MTSTRADRVPHDLGLYVRLDMIAGIAIAAALPGCLALGGL